MSLHASILNVKPELRPIHKMSIYSTRDGYTIIGFDRKKTAYNILKVKKGTPMNPNEEINLYRLITDEGKARSKEEIAAYLRMKKDELRFACKAYAIMGFIKLLQGYYMLAVTEAECVAKIGSHKIYKVNFVSYIPLFDEVPSSTTKKLEKRCLQCLKTFDLTSGFYFSDTYDLTNTFQTNIYAMSNNDPDFFTKRAYTPSNCQPIRNFNECFMWNYYLSKEFSNAIVNPRWIKGFIYGYLEQAKVQKGIISFQIVLIARRCRHHAGTRYLTRGINPEGFVGNFVEVEQIVLDLTNGTMYNPLCTSFVQVRGSVPVYWFQETRVYEPKPPIHMNPAADILFQATKKHFADLYSLYGPQIFVLNLVKKQNKREELLTAEFQNAIEYLNRDIPNDLKITYYHQDMKALLKRDREEFLSTTSAFAKIAIEKLGFFCAKIDPLDKHITPISFQAGVIRSNCVDCLDRTNTFQQLVGEVALSMQIAKLYENEKMKFHNPAEFLEDTLLKYFRGMYGRMGDLISLQYGGSIAHKPNIGTKESKKFEFLTSIKRYYSNTFMDQDRQNAINLFLGIYQPKLDGPPVWEMVSPIILAPNHKYLSQVLSSEK